MNHTDITTIILCGGRGRRMGGLDKGLINFCGRPLIEHILDAIKPQCKTIIINANRHIEQYSKYGYPVLADDLNDFQGPLAGFSMALEHATTPVIMTLPCDAPFIPENLITRFIESMQRSNSDIVVAHDGERMQPVYALIKTSLRANLRDFLKRGERKTHQWLTINNACSTDFSDIPEIFQNINTPEQQQSLQKIVDSQ